MASFSKNLLIFLPIFFSLHYLSISFEFQVGDTKGWVVPPSNNSKIYNDWASENRFQVGDTIRFKYKKDSVMEVTEEDYKKCNSTHPNFFSNTGNSLFKLDEARAFYFISGVAGHCQRGQRMIVKVIANVDSSPRSIEDHHSKSSSPTTLLEDPKLVIVQVVLLFVVSYYLF